MFFLTCRLSLKHGTLTLLARGAAYQMYLRWQGLPFQMDHAFSKEVLEITQAMKDSRFDLGEEKLQAPDNLHVYPILEFDEEQLRYLYLRKKKGFDDWIAQFREWSKHGI
jgi:hypothetical protein